ncbi:hypothetical protein [Flavobacterium aquidurense]|jgi:hypothetical protein|uniref:hypothetical protein n=1 Tax=Flavobacterium aquidurense TaxID=362413 RepID=UPI003722D76A
MKLISNYLFTLTSLFFINSIIAQKKPLIVQRYYPKDSVKYSKVVPDTDFNYESKLYGKTTMIIHCESEYGHFEFVFKKKINKLSRMIDYKNGAVGEVYNFKTKKWVHEEETWKHSDMKDKPQDTIIFSEHNLYAFVLLYDHGGMIEKAKFQDFGNVVYWPEFDYQKCTISDEDKDGKPEFYLSYMGDSDGLDAKPFKQIIYTIPEKSVSQNFIKSKATAYYPSGNEDDVYRIEYDENWKQLSKAVKLKSQKIIKDHSLKYKD